MKDPVRGKKTISQDIAMLKDEAVLLLIISNDSFDSFAAYFRSFCWLARLLMGFWVSIFMDENF